jgi:hypothetical protein
VFTESASIEPTKKCSIVVMVVVMMAALRPHVAMMVMLSAARN